LSLLYANVVLEGAAVAAVWLTSSGIGAMIGNFAAVLENKPPDQRAQWRDLGGAMGCAFGFLLMVCSIAVLARS
jgi:hypothetical protein